MINWHRLFGLTLTDYFSNTGYEVEVEKDLALKRQLLDVLVIRGQEQPLPDPCDGLEQLRSHNLITYKSEHESLDEWALEELLGHYVNYRKAAAPEAPSSAFGLFAVTTRYPRELFRRYQKSRIKCCSGVYQLPILSHNITVIVLKRVAPQPHNALWELFSFDAERISRGVQNYQWREHDHITLLNNLHALYQKEQIAMSYTFEDYRKEYYHDMAQEILASLSPEEVLKKFPPEKLFKGLSPEERLRGLPPEERLKGLPPEERLKGLPPEERLKGLDTQQLEQLRALLEQESLKKGK